MASKINSILAKVKDQILFSILIVLFVTVCLFVVVSGLMFVAVAVVLLGKFELNAHLHTKHARPTEQPIVPDKDLSRILAAECATRTPCNKGNRVEVQSCT